MKIGIICHVYGTKRIVINIFTLTVFKGQVLGPEQIIRQSTKVTYTLGLMLGQENIGMG